MLRRPIEPASPRTRAHCECSVPAGISSVPALADWQVSRLFYSADQIDGRLNFIDEAGSNTVEWIY